VELYDSGTTHHISPYRDDFINFVKTEPRPLTAANKGRFAAVREGDIVVEVPNGTMSSKLSL
ncbi:hypothetical protein BDN72DRAFT_737567, partial [Pluteus cervinus]